ncbi:MAG: tryptophan--tRNA ligase [Atribacterota bacterium]|jgi:tryptophanyl-tRNA synthetase|nr:tryptophan--tRNA ligase [Atribacterota bacterium]MDD5497170.1 tryptophan--tRNA ligase [Atribacterota bacterium]
MKGIIFSGMRPTGKLHIGNYFGALMNWVQLQNDYKCYYGVVDWHALTTGYDETAMMKENIIEMVIDWLSAGIDPDKSTLLIQSHVPEHAELHLLLSMITPVSWLERNPVLKEQVRDLGLKENIGYGLLGYPVLMATDILIYKSNAVPVGEDQSPHIELAREIGRRFNSLYQNVFTIPELKLSPTPKILGIDGRKMSKSLKNDISLSDNPEDIKTKVMSMITDPEKIRLSDPGHPEICVVFNYHGLFNKKELADIEKKCRQAQLGCVECKKRLAEILIQSFQIFREKRKHYERNPQLVWDILDTGSQEARKVARITLDEVKKAMNMDYAR